MSGYNRPPYLALYPRTGQVWSIAEDRDLLHGVEWTKATTKQIAGRHKRTPGAIASRVMLLRDRRIEAEDKALMERREIKRGWASERETARQAVSKIKEAYAGAMWPGERDKTFSEPPRQRGVKPGVLFRGASPCIVVARPYGIDLVALSDLPPEVAQALQFGGEA